MHLLIIFSKVLLPLINIIIIIIKIIIIVIIIIIIIVIVMIIIIITIIIIMIVIIVIGEINHSYLSLSVTSQNERSGKRSRILETRQACNEKRYITTKKETHQKIIQKKLQKLLLFLFSFNKQHIELIDL